jgi:CTP:molybdopterin cytidylyltransferase MocA
MLENIFAGVKQVATLNPAAHHVLLASSDIPAITPEMVDWLARTAAETDHDVYYNVITRQVMEARYPGSRRTYTHLKGMEVCGGDMNVVRAQTTTGKDDLWRKIIAARKSPLKQAALVGFDNVILLLLRLMSIDEAVKRASQRTGLRARVLRCPYAEIGMDVDKPHQLELMRADMTKRLQVAG